MVYKCTSYSLRMSSVSNDAMCLGSSGHDEVKSVSENSGRAPKKASELSLRQLSLL